MSNADTIDAIITNLLNRLNTESLNPKPSYTIDGQSVDWNTYFDRMMDRIERLRAQKVIEAPFEEFQRGM